MNYKKLAVYLLIGLVAIGVWFKNNRDKARRVDDGNRFAEAYAGTVVMAELFRNEPERFVRARDSIYQVYGFTPASIAQFQESLRGREEDWRTVWDAVHAKTDSLVKYYLAHPVIHEIPDSLGAVSPAARP
ncbi:MAG: hypothetical protein GYA46_05040 [candidate division Zixibacteria bacterium]|nr:hypothetical protein [candidate division Zixibacteria bacterium]